MRESAMGAPRAGCFVVLAGILGLAVQAEAQGSLEVFSEGFDTLSPPALPSGWNSSRMRSALQDDFSSTASVPLSPPNALLSTNATIAQSLTSPTIDLKGCLPEVITFAIRRSASHLGKMILEIAAGDGDLFVQVGDTIRPSGAVTYEPVSIPLPGHLQGSAALRLRWRTIAEPGGASGTLRIDDVRVLVRPACDVFIAGVMLTPEVAEESSRVSAHVAIANGGSEPSGYFPVVIGCSLDGDSLLSDGEIWGRAVFSSLVSPGDTSEVTLEFAAPSAGEYRLVVEAQLEADQAPGNNHQWCRLDVRAQPGALLVNEIFYAPPPGVPEWIELLNPTGRSLLLTGWTLADGSSAVGKEITRDSVMMLAGSYVVLTRDTTALFEAAPGLRGRAIGMAGFPSLNNGGDAVVLRDHLGTMIDSLWYDSRWGGDDGTSLERKDVNAPSVDSANWGGSQSPSGSTPGEENSIAILDTDLAIRSCSVTGGGPGEAAEVRVILQNVGRRSVEMATLELYLDRNGDGAADPIERLAGREAVLSLAQRESCAVSLLWDDPPGGRWKICVFARCEGDRHQGNNALWLMVSIGSAPLSVQLNEVLFDPLPGQAEFVELANVSPDNVDLEGWNLREGGGAKPRCFPLTQGSAILHPGDYFVLACDSSVLNAFPLCPADHTHVLGVTSLQLNNDGDTMVLLDAAGRTIDSLTYSESWHSPSLLKTAGRSLEKVRPDLPSPDPRNWSSSVDRRGATPGQINSIWLDRLPEHATLSVSPNPFSPDGDGVEDFTAVHYEIPLEHCTMTMKIFDIRGRLVRRLVKNEPCASRGMVIWDGLDEERRRARIGIYLLLLEAEEGSTQRVWKAKIAVAVAGRL